MSKILFMEDDTVLTRIMSNQLSNLGYTVDTASESGHTVELYMHGSSSSYGGVIIDLYVPVGMSGLLVSN